MEENTQAAVTQTPTQEPVGTAADASPAAVPPAGEDGSERSASLPGDTIPREPEPEDLISYRFNHETKTVSRKEAPEMIQRLLKVRREAEKATPLLDKLRFLAEAGGKTPEEYLTSLQEGYDRAEYDRFLQSAGGNEAIAAKLSEMSKKERQQRFRTTDQLREEQEEREREDLTRRMGAQLADLRKEFPEIGEFRDLPESVIKEALEEEITLLDSFLRYRHRNTVRSTSQKERQEQAAAASAGSLRGEPEQKKKVDENVSAFIAAFRS